MNTIQPARKYTAIALMLGVCYVADTFAGEAEIKLHEPGAPSNLNVSAEAGDTINLSWNDNSGNEMGFEVERSEDGVSWHSVATVGADVAEFRDSGVSPDGHYSYRVSAFNTAGQSDFSNEDSAMTWESPEIVISMTFAGL